MFFFFFTSTLARLFCYEMSCAYITRLQLVGLWASKKPSCLEERLATDIQSAWIVMLCMSSLFVYSDPGTFRHRVSHVVSF